MDAEPILEEQKPMSKIIYWLLGVLVIGAIFAAAAFMYYRSPSNDVGSINSPATSTTEPTTEESIVAAQTVIASLSDEIDQELAEIDNSLASTEDDTSDL